MNNQIEARIDSLKGGFDTVTILSQNGNNNIVVQYKGKKCTAIFNPFTNCYYVDDVYGVIKEV